MLLQSLDTDVASKVQFYNGDDSENMCLLAIFSVNFLIRILHSAK